jgi:hypothetical protein
MVVWQLIAKGESPHQRGALSVRYNTNVYEEFADADSRIADFREKLIAEKHMLDNKHLLIEVVPLTVKYASKWRSIDAA